VARVVVDADPPLGRQCHHLQGIVLHAVGTRAPSFIHPSAECVEFADNDGPRDHRTTLRKILKERNKRHGWKSRKTKAA
jgi:hypothetical protein